MTAIHTHMFVVFGAAVVLYIYPGAIFKAYVFSTIIYKVIVLTIRRKNNVPKDSICETTVVLTLCHGHLLANRIYDIGIKLHDFHTKLLYRHDYLEEGYCVHDNIDDIE